ncbi:MAG: hypothetical protein R3D55_03830 [Chloroflexota bacterium]
MTFEWQTDEEYEWEQTSPEPEPPRRRRRWPWLLLVAVVVAGTAVFLIYRQLNQRVDAATEETEAELLASYAVWQRAVQNQDENLFGSLLSGRDAEWVAAQRALLQSGMVFDRSGFGLAWEPGVGETAVLSQNFSPDLTAVELTTLQNYTWNVDNGLTQTVQLARTDVYRLGADRWLYAPPEPEFWGETQELNGQLLTATYPARDEEIVQRLAADLEAKLVYLCNTTGYDCPADAQVRLAFSTEPDSLLEATFLAAFTRDQGEIGAVWTGDEAIVLPTPTLVGLPQDASGYIAYFRGYAAQMLAVAVTDLVGWDCCENVPFYQAALTAQLADLGVLGWPLADSAVSLPNDFSLPTAAQSWQAPFPETPTDFAQRPGPYVVVHWLRQTVGLSPSEMMRSVTAVPPHTLADWLTDQLGPPWTEALLNDAFRQYVARWQPDPATTLALADGLLLACATRNPLRIEQGLYYFDDTLAEPVLLEEIPAGTNYFFTGLPDGSGVAVSTQDAALQPETYFLFDGSERVDVEWSAVEGVTSRPPQAVPTVMVGNGRFLLWTVSRDYANGNFFAFTDVAACQSGQGCAAQPVGGYPTWSPTGEQLISLSVIRPWWTEGLENGMMLLREEPTSPAIHSPGFGASVFWLDETEFGYLTQFQNGVQQLMLANVDLSSPRVLLTNQSLVEQVPPLGGVPDDVALLLAQPLPRNPQVLAILATGRVDGTTLGHLYFYDYVAETMVQYVPLPDWQNATLGGYRFSPDGRFLLITYANPDETVTNMLIYDADGPAFFLVRLDGSTSLPRHFYASWSPNGDWLVLPENGYLRLWQRGSNERLLNFEGLGCVNAAWVDRIEMVNGE